ncbi:MAG: thiamine pyrophosphate-binding protein [Eubacteriales bacterium]|nr:thiamine pyrophosphate-binding protein [Eubacteriales bacterium]
MNIKLSKYVAALLVKNGITQCFSVTGGGAMHLNDGLGHQPGLNTLYMHHEQSCSIAAESYARVYNKPAVLSLTTGPGGTNGITGVVGAWLDSIPMIVISGQVRYDNTARWSGVGIRSMGDQEFDITRSIDCMTKYSKMVLDPSTIRYEVEKCIWLCQHGRPGPCWLDIPVDIQGCFIEDSELKGFDPDEYLKEKEAELDRIDEAEEKEYRKERGRFANSDMEDGLLNISFRKQRYQSEPGHVTKDSPEIAKIIEKIRSSKRPVFYTGNGIRIAGAENLFLKVADKLGIPVVVGWNAIDIIPHAHPLKAGQPGGRGDRPGNFAVQNADFILSVGSRLSIRQVGYNFRTWAREAFTVVCDIDEEELKKPSVHIDIPIHADAYELLKALDDKLTELGIQGHGIRYNRAELLKNEKYGDGRSLFGGGEGKDGRSWLEQCAYWMKKYDPYMPEYADHGDDENVNVYEFMKVMSEALSEEQITVTGNGSACVVGAQVFRVKDGTRFISQDAIAAMGYDLPAAIGACTAVHDVSGHTYPVSYDGSEIEEDRSVDNKLHACGEMETALRLPGWRGRTEHYPSYYKHDIICQTGDGSIMMNLQELQTIASHRMPIKIFMINNGGYHSIRQTQTNLFNGEPLVGIGVDSYDLSFPDFKRVTEAFGMAYRKIEHNSQLQSVIDEVLSFRGPVLCEVFVSLDQPFQPGSAVKKHPDGSLSSPPLEDLKPFLSEEELLENMFIPLVKE